MARRILHADMDAFYAAVEELDHPEWKDVPLVVGADPRKGQGRGVVSTCNYIARKFGIRSAMPVSRAYSLCPEAVFVPPRMDRYIEFSEQIMEIFSRYSPAIEPLSLDEAFLDCSGTERLFGNDESLGKQIKADVRRETRLTVSIGISAIKFVAKIASDLRKPDGLVVVAPGTEKDFLAPLPVERLWGAGPRTCKQLKDSGIFTIGDVAMREPSRLPGAGRGKHWQHLMALARAEDPRGVQPHRERKSIGEERTFGKDLFESEALRLALLKLCRELSYRVRKTGFRGRTITLKFRYTGFETHTRSRTVAMPVITETGLRALALQLWEEIDKTRDGRSIRLLGVQISHAESESQPDLFSTEFLEPEPVANAGSKKTDRANYSSANSSADSQASRNRGGKKNQNDGYSRSDSILEEGKNLARDQKLESTMDQINEKYGQKLQRGIQ